MIHIQKSLWALALLVPFFAQGQERLEPHALHRIPPSMLTLERCLKAMELPEGEHKIN
jgi:hypothetical protein